MTRQKKAHVSFYSFELDTSEYSEDDDDQDYATDKSVDERSQQRFHYNSKRNQQTINNDG